MKKGLCFLLCMALWAELPAAAHAAPKISAQSAVVIHADSRQVLYEHNADAPMLIASTTKIMTAVVALERLELSEPVLVTAEAVGVEGSSAYLKAGERYTVGELLYGMMLVSGNDAAMALALHTAGSVEAFAELMNEKAAELGMENSSFRNPHGLDEEGHYSTARDMALLTAFAIESEDFRAVVSCKSAEAAGQTYVNHNRLLWSCEGVFGVKTGYTKAAGRSLVSCCERNGLRLICVTLGDPDDWDDHAALYDRACDRWRYVTYTGPDSGFELPLISGIAPTVRAVPETELKALESGDEIEAELRYELPRFVFAPVAAGEQLGRVRLFRDGVELCSCAIVAAESASLSPAERLTPLERLARFVSGSGILCPRVYYLTDEDL